VLLSEATRALIGTSVPDGVSVVSRGKRQLKGIEEPQQVFELQVDGVEPPAEEPAEPAKPEPDELGKRLAETIEQSVARRLGDIIQRFAPRPDTPASEDAAVETIASRSASLEETIRARVEAALRARGIPDDLS